MLDDLRDIPVKEGGSYCPQGFVPGPIRIALVCALHAQGTPPSFPVFSACLTLFLHCRVKMLRLLCPLCVVTYVFMRGPTVEGEVFDFPENGPSVITKPQWIDREKVVEVIHDTKLTKEQRIEKIKGMPIHESEANTKIWLSHLPTVIDFFDWAGQEKAKASPKAKEVIAKGEKMFGVDFMMQDEKEQSRTLLRFALLNGSSPVPHLRHSERWGEQILYFGSDIGANCSPLNCGVVESAFLILVVTRVSALAEASVVSLLWRRRTFRAAGEICLGCVCYPGTIEYVLNYKTLIVK
ncbi:hypothetical protein Y032_0651g1150 [Ancylostoma ceylanicum]|uniref:Uncharacterized protein n=1 Tax=Ancylostoma ceylanicum TaxID=53326 RepID=A0A016WIX0_9BILA|nr:hypothetical protein Y032_0651g1150 [Ancylostoma ceylanicum]